MLMWFIEKFVFICFFSDFGILVTVKLVTRKDVFKVFAVTIC